MQRPQSAYISALKMDGRILEVWHGFINFISLNWGSLASVLGAIATVYFSISAAKNARIAKEASEATRSRIQKIDLLTELNRINNLVDDVLRRLETSAWPMVSERSTDIRVSLSAIVSSHSENFDENLLERLILAISQFKNIAAGADRASLDENNSPDVGRYRRISTDQKETITLALQSIKVQMGVE